MSLILALSPTNTLIAELPSANGTRRKINLSANKLSQSAIENAIEILRDISNIIPDPDTKTNQSKAKDLMDQLQNKIETATNAANALSSILKEDNTCLDIIYRILEGQTASKISIGEDGAPTSAQVIHWERHGALCEDQQCPKNKKGISHSHEQLWSDPSCPHCKTEGRFEPGKNRERSVKGLSENEALRLGLIYRGYKKSNPKNPTQWTRTNYPTCYLLPDGKVLDSKKIQWLKSHREALITDGKLHAKSTGFIPLDTKSHKHQGTVVRKLVTRAKSTPVSKINAKDLMAAF